jgi:hypothetical protein
MTSPTRQHPSVARLQAFGLGLLEAQETEAIVRASGSVSERLSP